MAIGRPSREVERWAEGDMTHPCLRAAWPLGEGGRAAPGMSRQPRERPCDDTAGRSGDAEFSGDRPSPACPENLPPPRCMGWGTSALIHSPDAGLGVCPGPSASSQRVPLSWCWGQGLPRSPRLV